METIFWRRRGASTPPATAAAAAATAAAVTGAALALAFVAGCSSVDLSEPAAPARTVTVANAQAGRQVELRLDQELVVRLATQPASGFRWMPDGPNDGAVLASVVRQGFERQTRDVNPFEAAGFDVFRFKPKTVGQQTLRFEYRRPGVLDPTPPETLWYLVTVR